MLTRMGFRAIALSGLVVLAGCPPVPPAAVVVKFPGLAAYHAAILAAFAANPATFTNSNANAQAQATLAQFVKDFSKVGGTGTFSQAERDRLCGILPILDALVDFAISGSPANPADQNPPGTVSFADAFRDFYANGLVGQVSSVIVDYLGGLAELLATALNSLNAVQLQSLKNDIASLRTLLGC